MPKDIFGISAPLIKRECPYNKKDWVVGVQIKNLLKYVYIRDYEIH
jgi:hypothetical protein